MYTPTEIESLRMKLNDIEAKLNELSPDEVYQLPNGTVFGREQLKLLKEQLREAQEGKTPTKASPAKEDTEGTWVTTQTSENGGITTTSIFYRKCPNPYFGIIPMPTYRSRFVDDDGTTMSEFDNYHDANGNLVKVSWVKV